MSPCRHVVLPDKYAAHEHLPALTDCTYTRLRLEVPISAAACLFRDCLDHELLQVPLGNYIADFAAPAAKLVVEVDGAYHSRHQVADARRDRNLRRLGYRVLRLEASLVEQHLELAVARIRAALAESP